MNMMKKALPIMAIVLLLSVFVSSIPVEAASKPKIKATVWYEESDYVCREISSLSVRKGHSYTLKIEVKNPSKVYAKGVKLSSLIPKTISSQGTANCQFMLSSTNTDNVIKSVKLRNKSNQELSVKYVKGSAYIICPDETTKDSEGGVWMCYNKISNKVAQTKGAKLWSSRQHQYDGKVGPSKELNSVYVILKIKVS